MMTSERDVLDSMLRASPRAATRAATPTRARRVCGRGRTAPRRAQDVATIALG
jgi:hypothetical protein